MHYLVKSFKKTISYSIRSPLDLSLFKTKENIDTVQCSLKARFRDQNIAHEISQKLNIYKQQLYNLEQLNKKANSLKNDIKSVMTKKSDVSQKQKAEKMKQQMASVKENQKNKQVKIKQLITDIQNKLLKVGNVVHQDVPVSKDQINNKCLNKYFPYGKNQSLALQQQIPLNQLNKSSQKYQQINEFFSISDLKRGQKVSGHRGYFLKTNGLKLALALTQYGVEFLQNEGYQLYQTPAIIFENILKQNCQLQTVQNDMYKLQGEQSYLIATSQQCLAGYYKGQVIQPKQLPIRMGGYSSCFRKQAGAHGKDIHGLFRVHQFEKIQQFLICQPNKSNEQMRNMLDVSQRFYQSLKIPYQVVDIVSGQLNDAAIRKFDLQGWYPSQKRYRQLVSISNCTDYQSRLANITYRKGSQTEPVHMLNGTLTAVQRTLTCIMQNYYDSQNKLLRIPQKLQKYFGKQYVKPNI